VDSDDFAWQSAPDANVPSFLQTGEVPVFSTAEATPTKNAASKEARELSCPQGAKPNCPVFSDKLDLMRGTIKTEWNAKDTELNAHNTRCETELGELNTQIVGLTTELSDANTQLTTHEAQLKFLINRFQDLTSQKAQLCEELREKYHECWEELNLIQREQCGYLKIRQAVYNKVMLPNMKAGDMSVIIQDCQVSDWTIEACSSTCEDADGNGGVQIIRRDVVVKWDPEFKDTNGDFPFKYGASCPPNQVVRDCADARCPVDCELRQWSGWDACTVECGGGSQARSRAIVAPAEYGGIECGGLSEGRKCNTDACDQDCILYEWSSWTPCTKSCKWRRQAAAGITTHERKIRVASKGQGKCPLPKDRARFMAKKCNNFVCPKDIECKSDVDLVMVLDSSGSLWNWGGKRDQNWLDIKQFSNNLVKKAKMAEMDADTGMFSNGMRIGIIKFSYWITNVAELSNDKKDLIKRINGPKMKWERSMTYTSKALYAAQGMFANGSPMVSRQKIVMIVTDGRPSYPKRAAEAAKKLRAAGIRIMTVPVKTPKMLNDQMCQDLTSPPCKENQLETPTFQTLLDKINWYLTAYCSVIESKPQEDKKVTP